MAEPRPTRRRATALVALPAALVLAVCGSSAGPAAPSTSPSTIASSSAAPTSSAPPSTSAPAPSSASSSASSIAAPSSSHVSVPPPRAPSTSPAPRTSASSGSAALTVVLNPGHNGGNAAHTAEIDRQVPAGYGDSKSCDTTGTETNAGYSEHAFNWAVSRDVATVLRAHSIRVIMTRTSDTGVGPCVDERAAIGNHPDVAAVVSIHADGAPSAGHGFHVNQDSRVPDGATPKVARQSDALGQAIHAALVRSSGLVPSTYIGRNGYYYRTDLAGLNLATRPATFLELGNMRNAGDARLQSSASGRQQIADAVAAGILAYLDR